MCEATSPSVRIAGLYAIADLPAPEGIDAVAYASALLGGLPEGPGPCALQLRAKSASHEERCQLLRELAPRCSEAGVLLIANDDVEAALKIPGVHGVHVGQEDLGENTAHARLRRVEGIRRAAHETGRALIIGLSTHSLEQVSEAANLPVDYIGFGPIFPTKSKVGADPSVGLATLRRASELSAHPVVAIGGLDERSAAAALQAGAAAIALISALRRSSVAAIKARALALSDLFLATSAQQESS